MALEIVIVAVKMWKAEKKIEKSENIPRNFFRRPCGKNVKLVKSFLRFHSTVESCLWNVKKLVKNFLPDGRAFFIVKYLFIMLLILAGKGR